MVPNESQHAIVDDLGAVMWDKYVPHAISLKNSHLLMRQTEPMQSHILHSSHL